MDGSVERASADGWRGDREVLFAQVVLLYANASLGAGITVVAAGVLASLQWGTVSWKAIAGWWSYMAAISLMRYALSREFSRSARPFDRIVYWRRAIVVCFGLAGLGWGAAGILLYSDVHLIHQVFIVFVIGGIMLGAGSLLAARPEAFLCFLLPAGIGPTIRLLLQGDDAHRAMGLLTAIFTSVVLITARQIYRTLDLSIRLQFENRDLVENLRAANSRAEALNQVLEQRVEERTADLRQATEKLRIESAQRERTEEELLKARKLESLGVLAGGIAHDFNNFLTVIQGNIELVRTRLESAKAVGEILDRMSKACAKAAFLSSQLLTFAKGGSPVRRPVALGKVLMDAVQLARAGAPVSFDVRIAEDLWPVKADKTQISQVLYNIFLNAKQSMQGTGIIEVCASNAASQQAEGRIVSISVRDYGCGIPSEMLSRIFDPYFTTRMGASGLGLATAYAIVAKHGGRITVESEPGRGSLFIIQLPATDEAAARQEVVIPKLQSSTASKRLLVMDDEEAVRGLLKDVLMHLGYQVATARDGAEAIAIYEREKIAGTPFAAVLLDLTVSGGMGGVEAAAKLKEIEPSAKLIVSSGYSDAPVMSDYAQYGFDAIVPKPWTVAQIADVFRQVVAGIPDYRSDFSKSPKNQD